MYITQWLTVGPTAVASAAPQNGVTSLTLQTVASLGTAPHPDWVSYFVKDPQGNWVHSTLLHAPAHSLVKVTVYQYDTATGLRNPFWAQPQGVIGKTITLDGKTVTAIDPDLASHTFAVPDLGVSGAARGRRRRRQEPVLGRALHDRRGAPHDHVHASAPVRRAATAGSASCPAAPASCSASAARCRPSGTWTDS